MAVKRAETSFIFRQVPFGRIKQRSSFRRHTAANDNILSSQDVQATSPDDSPSLTDVFPILVLMAMSGGTIYFISTVLSGYLAAFPLLYP
ncbi:hypothetical protein GGQ64_004785 [Rhizobium azooxidifex]|uniref:Uncharacterized protein n=1 Tax=Mycoplana azooxidifex TaxID=1636188 RepID=A0A7W6DE25_9HYPH|nr:hypothetical protein [Mycoplana azooxidifex]MBB3979541.1 hypothetical protein [Mycoplana azooxidifex]